MHVDGDGATALIRLGLTPEPEAESGPGPGQEPPLATEAATEHSNISRLHMLPPPLLILIEKEMEKLGL